MKKSLIIAAVVLAGIIGLAQFSSNQTNVHFFGSDNQFTANSTVTFNAASSALFKAATANQLIYSKDSAGTLGALGLGANLTITGGNLVATASSPTITLTVPTGFGVTGSPLTGSGTLAINTTLSGVLKGNGSGIVAATAGTDFLTSGVTATLTNKTISGANNTLTIRAENDITGNLTVAHGGTGLTSGTSGGIPYFFDANTIAASPMLDAAQIVLGQGAGNAPITLGALGTNTTVLHGNSSGSPAFGQVDLTVDVSGILPFNSGGTGLANGTSGGVLFFNTTNSLQSSGVLTANRIVVGGGSGTTPTVLGSSGTTTTVLHGNATGLPAYSNIVLSTDVSGTLPVGNGGTGAVTLTANNVIIGNGTNSVTFLAPGTSGNIITSNGSAWNSAAPASTPGGSTTQVQFNSSGSFAGSANFTWNGTAINIVAPGANALTVTNNASGTVDIITINNTNANGNGRFSSKNDLGHTMTMAQLGHSISFGLGDFGSLASDTGLIINSDGNVSSGGSDPIQFRVGGYTNLVANMTTTQFNMINSLQIVPDQLTGILGTNTTNSANSGVVGEIISAILPVGTPVSMTTATPINIRSVSLTAGDWDVQGQINFTETTSTVTARSAGISSTTGTLPTDGSEAYCGVQSTLTSELNSITLSRKRISLGTTTTIFLVGSATFSAGTCGGFGVLTARRVR